jgi:curved DNA-binding protein CbpA
MRPGITWYDILDTLPDASSEDIQQANDAKAFLLTPELLPGAPSKVVTAAARAQGIIDAARRVLGDLVSRQRDDQAADLWRGGVSGQHGDSPARSGLPGFDSAAGNPGAEVLSGCGLMGGRAIHRHRRPQGRRT